jgi:hypothetical protein
VPTAATSGSCQVGAHAVGTIRHVAANGTIRNLTFLHATNRLYCQIGKVQQVVASHVGQGTRREARPLRPGAISRRQAVHTAGGSRAHVVVTGAHRRSIVDNGALSGATTRHSTSAITEST